MRLAAVVAAVLGIVDSLYLLCSETFCSSVCRLQVLPFPSWVACLAAIIWFSMTFFAARNRSFAAVWAAAGVAGIAFFATYAVLKNYYCPYCFSAYFFGAAAVIAVLRQESGKKEVTPKISAR